jgi:hypothetical protein
VDFEVMTPSIKPTLVHLLYYFHYRCSVAALVVAVTATEAAVQLTFRNLAAAAAAVAQNSME